MDEMDTEVNPQEEKAGNLERGELGGGLTRIEKIMV